MMACILIAVRLFLSWAAVGFLLALALVCAI
jgi:hypothetical protein